MNAAIYFAFYGILIVGLVIAWGGWAWEAGWLERADLVYAIPVAFIGAVVAALVARHRLALAVDQTAEYERGKNHADDDYKALEQHCREQAREIETWKLRSSEALIQSTKLRRWVRAWQGIAEKHAHDFGLEYCACPADLDEGINRLNQALDGYKAAGNS